MEMSRAMKAAISTDILLDLTWGGEGRLTKSALVHRATERVANLATEAIMANRQYEEEEEAAYG
jgi:hypothetical protein